MSYFAIYLRTFGNHWNCTDIYYVIYTNNCRKNSATITFLNYYFATRNYFDVGLPRINALITYHRNITIYHEFINVLKKWFDSCHAYALVPSASFLSLAPTAALLPPHNRLICLPVARRLRATLDYAIFDIIFSRGVFIPISIPRSNQRHGLSTRSHDFLSNRSPWNLASSRDLRGYVRLARRKNCFPKNSSPTSNRKWSSAMCLEIVNPLQSIHFQSCWLQAGIYF